MTRYTKSGTVNTVQEINSELEKIATAQDEFLTRNGEAPNEMKNTLDMNSNRITNLKAPVSGTDAARLVDVTGEYDITVGIDETPVFDNIAEMTSTNLAVGQLIRCKRYYSGGELVDGLVYEIQTSVLVDGYIDHALANGTFAILINNGTITAKQAGAVTDGSDNSLNIQASFDYISNLGAGTLIFTEGTYTMNSKVIGDFTNKKISIKGENAVIDATSPTFSGNYVIEFIGSQTQIENLGANAVLGGTEVTFDSAPSLSEDSLFSIWNPTGGSWSGYRSQYNQGEYCVVKSITGSVVSLENHLYDDYVSSDVNVYRLDPCQVTIDGLTINGDVSTGLVVVRRGRNIVININATSSNNSCVFIDQCYNVAVGGERIKNLGAGGAGNDYGVSISGCQIARITTTDIYSRRHAVATGGTGTAGTVICRDLKIIGCNLKNDPDSGVHCADFHGNTEASQYIDCTIQGGAPFQGKDNGLINCDIYEVGNTGFCIYGAEIKGGSFYARNCRFYTFNDPSGSGRGIVDIGGNSSAIQSFATETIYFELTDCTFIAKNSSSSTAIMRLENDGAVQNINVEINRVNIIAPDILAVLSTKVNSGSTTSDYMIVDNIKAAGISGKLLILGDYLNVPLRLQEQSGSEELTTDIASNSVTGTPVTFKWRYIRPPVLTMARYGASYLANRIGTAYAASLTGTGLTPKISTDDGTDFSASVGITVGWTVGLKEV